MKTTWKSHHENDGLSKYGGRDCVGYGQTTPKPKWPNGAKVAVNFVINYEEGGEKCLLHGDTESEKLLTEIAGAEAYGALDSFCRSIPAPVYPLRSARVIALGARHSCCSRWFDESSHTCRALFFCLPKKTEGERHPNMESLYDYGSRAGFWRLHRLFTSKKIPCTVFAVGMVRSSLLLVIGNFLIVISLRGDRVLRSLLWQQNNRRLTVDRPFCL